MKRKITNCLATTGLSLCLLSIVAIVYQARFLCVETIFQVLAANILIHLGFIYLERFESRYFLVEIVMEMGYIVSILMLFGVLFSWYESTPLSVLLLLGLAVYLLGGIIDIFRIRNDMDCINKELALRKED